MKQIFKEGARLFGRLIIVFFMSVFICVSISGICTAIFTEEIGYEVYGLRKNEEKPVLLYTHYSKDGEDAAMKEYEGQGYSLRKVEIRSDLGKTGKAVQMTLTQTLALLVLIAAIYPQLWQTGASDSNAVRFGHMAEDRLKGLKIGLVAQMPDFLLWGATVFLARGLRSEMSVAAYRLIHCRSFSFIQMILGATRELRELSVVQLLLLLLPLMIVPLIAWIGYALGYANISVGEKCLYKKSNGEKR